jgi:hypothetical protein
MLLMSGDVAIRELDWYLRDHLFRQSNTGKTAFRRESLPGEMVTLYLRYRGADQQKLSELMAPVLESMVSRKVLEQNGNELKLSSALTRLQCGKCFYINYLVDAEPKTCMKCQHAELRDFPPKKKA